MIKDGFNDYIIISFVKYLLNHHLATKEKIYDILFNQKFNISFFNVFACNWNVFNKLCEFVFGFMNDLMFNGSYKSLNDINEWNNDISLFLNKEKFIFNEQKLFNDFNYGRVITPDRNII